MYYLYHVNTYVYFEIKHELVIGRTEGVLVFKDDAILSGKHLKFHLDPAGSTFPVMVEDLDSKNRSCVDRKQLIPNYKTRLKLYSMIEIGKQTFIVTDGNLKINEINDILEENAKKTVIKLESRMVVLNVARKELEEVMTAKKALQDKLSGLKQQFPQHRLEQPAQGLGDATAIVPMEKTEEMTNPQFLGQSEIDSCQAQLAEIEKDILQKQEKIHKLSN